MGKHNAKKMPEGIADRYYMNSADIIPNCPQFGYICFHEILRDKLSSCIVSDTIFSKYLYFHQIKSQNIGIFRLERDSQYPDETLIQEHNDVDPSPTTAFNDPVYFTRSFPGIKFQQAVFKPDHLFPDA
jgi:hypothetical protein